jgi:hypothetical protein
VHTPNNCDCPAKEECLANVEEATVLEVVKYLFTNHRIWVRWLPDVAERRNGRRGLSVEGPFIFILRVAKVCFRHHGRKRRHYGGTRVGFVLAACNRPRIMIGGGSWGPLLAGDAMVSGLHDRKKVTKRVDVRDRLQSIVRI